MDDLQLTHLEKLVKPQYERLQSWAHAWPHIQKVGKNSEELAQLVGVDPTLCKMAAYCHDLGRIEEEMATRKIIKCNIPNHSLFSIEPTISVLQELEIPVKDYKDIVEAVTVHSNKFYWGENLVAKVLRDADKKDSLGPWGVLRTVKDNFGMDLVSTDLILVNIKNPRIIWELAEQTHLSIKNDEKIKKAYLNLLDFVLEWVDKKMLDTPQAYDFLKEDYDYTRRTKEYLKR
ncbi:MAG: HD domain-containing protein [Candidatus Woesearchaeota archaeon]